MKYLANVKFKGDGGTVARVFESEEEMNKYVEVDYAEFIEKVIVKIKFSNDPKSHYIEILSK